MQWNVPLTKLLIANYRQMESQFANKTITQAHSFDDLATLMRSSGRIVVTGEQCKRRWMILTDTYKHIRDYNGTSGFDRREDFPYFELMEDIMGKKPECDPVSLASNLSGFKRKIVEDNIENFEEEDYANYVTSPTRKTSTAEAKKNAQVFYF